MGRSGDDGGAGALVAATVSVAVVVALGLGAAVVLGARRLADAVMPDAAGAGAPRWGLPSDDHVDAGETA